jgi:acyl-CoA reductase-like NAD-dependent aldehyde dehydrogenase
MEQVQLLIGDRSVDATNAATFTRTSPVSGEAVTRAAAASVADVKAAVDAAAVAFLKWSATGPSERRALLLKAADSLDARAAQFAALMTAETGATAPWGHFNVHLAAGMLREAAAMTSQIGGEVVPSDLPGNLALAMRQPAGVVVGFPRGTRRSSWAFARLRCRSLAATRSFSRRRRYVRRRIG